MSSTASFSDVQITADLNRLGLLVANALESFIVTQDRFKITNSCIPAIRWMSDGSLVVQAGRLKHALDIN